MKHKILKRIVEEMGEDWVKEMKRSARRDYFRVDRRDVSLREYQIWRIKIEYAYYLNDLQRNRDTIR